MNTQHSPEIENTFINRQQRRAYDRAADKQAVLPQRAVDPAVKLARKLESLPLLKVQSFARRFARRASTASHLAKKLAPGSILRRPLESAARHNVCSVDQCQAELQARYDHANRNNA